MRKLLLVLFLLAPVSGAWAQGLPIIQYEVTSTGDSGGGTLRGAIEYFNTYTGPPYIINAEVVFAQSLNGATITVGSVLSVESAAGIQSVTVDASLLEDGITISGGGTSGVFFVDFESHLNLEKVCVVDGAALDGAGIYNDGGILWMNDCTVSGCTATGWGGALYNSGFVEMTNCTLYGNEAQEAPWADSGAIMNFGELFMQNCTVAGNDSGILSIYFDEFGIMDVRMRNTIVAGNNGVDVNFLGDGVPAVNHFTSVGNNLIGLGNAVDGSTFIEAGDATGVLDPLLGPLADNGGPCPTCVPLPGSPAINGAFGSDPTGGIWQLFETELDQRLAWREVGAASDIGAVEVQVETTVTSLADSGPGSLRQVMAGAVNGVTVVFAPALNGKTITLDGERLWLSTPRIRIDASSLPDGITVSGDLRSGVFAVQDEEWLVLRSLAITEGFSTDSFGGGIRVYQGGRLELFECTLYNCVATHDFDESFARNPNFIKYETGGAVFSEGDCRFVNSTFFGHRYAGQSEDAAYSDYGLDPQLGQAGAALFSEGPMEMEHCTVTGSEGGILIRSFGSPNVLRLRGTVVSGNATSDLDWMPNIGSTILTELNNVSSYGNNLVGSGSSVDGTVFVEAGDVTGVADPVLGRLLENGGPVPTCLPGPGSPLIDGALNPTISNTDWYRPPLSRDTRGSGRPVGVRRDIGAVERSGADSDGVSYAAYAAANGLIPNIAAAGGDGNGNGIPDIFDYGLNGFPDGKGRYSPRIAMENGSPVLRVPLPATGRPDTTTTVWRRSDLGPSGNWDVFATKVGEGDWTGPALVREAFPEAGHREAVFGFPVGSGAAPDTFFKVELTGGP